MPRGNEKTEANISPDNSGEMNAEQLIQSAYGDKPEELETASMKSVDEAATAALDLSTLRGPNGETVVSAAVRGGVTIIVFDRGDGALVKSVATAAKSKAPKPKTSDSK